MRITALLWILIAAASAPAQTTAKETDTIKALLVEVRQLRQDLEAMTVASQRVQIALYGLQMQDAAVARALQRADDARNKRLQLENARDHAAGEIQKWEAEMSSGRLKDDDRKAVEMRLAQLKQESEAIQAELASRQAAEAEASSLLRTEQVKLIEVQDRIQRLDKALETAGRK